MTRAHIKVCCIASLVEAHIAVASGIDVLGLLGDMPSSPRNVGLETAREIAQWAPPSVETFLLTASFTAEEIIRKVKYCATSAVQVAQHIDAGEYLQIAAELPHVKRVQVIHVEDHSTLDLLETYETSVDAFILDSGRVNATVGELGGTGKTHDWNISAEFVSQSTKPVFLAGGLNSGNVQQAIAKVAPFGIDVCSGVRCDGRLDAQLLTEFTNNAWQARESN